MFIQYKIIKYINKSEHNCINKSGTCSIYSINYMFPPLHWPSSGWHLTYQETIQSVWCTLGRGGARSRFTIVGSMKIRTLDRITNIWCQYPDLKCLRPIIEVCYDSTIFNRMLSGVGVAGRLHCIVRGVWGVGCVINTLRTGSFKLFKRPFPGFLTILTL